MFSLHKVLKDISTKIVNAITTIGQHTSTLTTLSNLVNTITTNGVRLEQRTLLWTNSNPYVAFSGQTISLNLSNYDGVEITMYSDATQHVVQTLKLNIGDSNLVCTPYAQLRYRLVSANSNGIAFGNGSLSGSYGHPWEVWETNNTVAIPYKIYGIKYINVGGVTKLLSLFKGVELCLV